MERFAWKAIVNDGMLDEYKKRHDEIWPEMTELLNEARIHNYSIWNIGNELFGYYECESNEEALLIQAQSEVVDRWDEHMKDLMAMVKDDKGNQVLPVQVFLHP